MREAWLEGKLENIDRLLMPAAHALVEARRDIERAAGRLTPTQLWQKPVENIASTGFHLRHIAGSIDRLLTYARGESLSERQLAWLAQENSADAAENAEQLISQTRTQIEIALDAIRAVEIETLFEPRFVGRERLETTVFGLLFHIAEHTQRHVGQIVTTAKIVSANSTETISADL